MEQKLIDGSANVIDPLFKVKNSPLKGAEVNHSASYRRLISEGYKGYVQGSLGGALLFGVFGAVLGLGMAAIAIPAGLTAGAAMMMIPVVAAGGILYGNHTFSTIGAIAAVAAAQADISEKRRSLLDRYIETPSVEEAREIERQLESMNEEHKPEKMYHWKSGLLGALVVGGAALLGIGILIASPPLGAALAHSAIGEMAAYFGTLEMGANAALIFGGLAGALAGSVVGIDRSYIRRWFDAQESIHEDGTAKQHAVEHQQKLDRLRQAFRSEGYTLETRSEHAQKLEQANTERQQIAALRTIDPAQPTPVNLDTSKPDTVLLAGNDNIREVGAGVKNAVAPNAQAIS